MYIYYTPKFVYIYIYLCWWIYIYIYSYILIQVLNLFCGVIFFECKQLCELVLSKTNSFNRDIFVKMDFGVMLTKLYKKWQVYKYTNVT